MEWSPSPPDGIHDEVVIGFLSSVEVMSWISGGDSTTIH